MRIILIGKKEFVAVLLDLEYKIFIVHVASVISSTDIYKSRRV